jgi:peptide/nickel transport system substrate-binding protein
MPVIWRRGVGALLAVAAGAALGFGGAHAAARPGQAAVVNGGTLTVGLWTGPPGNLDPDKSGGNATVLRTICEALYDADRHGRPVPLLASGPTTISKDKLTVTIPLRKGIVFNDGTPFNAQAVAATFERDITFPGSSRATILGQVTSATASGPYTVQLHLSSPNTALAYGLVNERIMSPTQVASLGVSFGSDPVCVGPYMFQSQVAGQSVTVVKSPYYYDSKDVHLDKIVFVYEPSDFAAQAALESGDVQALDRAPTAILKSLEDNGFRIVGSLSFGSYWIEFNLGNVAGSSKPYGSTGTPISNPLVRQAFEMAIDRKTLNRVIFGGENVPGCTPISPAAAEWYDPSITCTPYDPSGARKLVVESGIPDSTVQLLVPADVQDVTIAELIQAEEQTVGINVVIDPTDIAALTADTLAGDFQAQLSSSTPVKADPDWIFAAWLNSNGQPANNAGYSDPRLTYVLGESRKSISELSRQTYFRVAQQILLADRPAIWLDHIVDRAPISNDLVGVQVFPDGQLRVAFAAFKAT